MKVSVHSPKPVKSWTVELLAVAAYGNFGSWTVTAYGRTVVEAMADAIEKCPVPEETIREMRFTPESYA